ncbi:helix-turn-helix domain-containing protein [Streptosporangium canum]|uniref:helix-turn-helix domain-containing protein n=1 Tax=Streptosporangium canum TaxID=324952 RepID=UPI0037986686
MQVELETQRFSPLMRQQELGRLLRELRSQQQLNLGEAAHRVGWSRSKVGKVETGETLVFPGDIARLLDVYDADLDTRRRCGELVQQARAKPWWKEYQHGLGDLGPLVSLETEASLIRYWQPQLIPGQLQTEDYARAVIEAHYPWEDDLMIKLRVRARLARQWITRCDNPVIIQAVIGEDALRRPVGGPQVMAGQLAALVDAFERPNISIRVLPRSVGAHAGLTSGFLLISFPSMLDALFLESGTGGIIDHGPQVAEFGMRFEHIAAASLSPAASADLIVAIRRENRC